MHRSGVPDTAVAGSPLGLLKALVHNLIHIVAQARDCSNATQLRKHQTLSVCIILLEGRERSGDAACNLVVDLVHLWQYRGKTSAH